MLDSDAKGTPPWFATELVDGPALRDVIEGLSQRPDRFDVIRTWIRDLASALAHLHDRGFVHRDVNLNNLLLRGGDHIVLIDFGVCARAAESTEVIVGTATAIAPEQIAGAPADGRADLYGLGCVLYQLLTSRRPFTGQTTQALYDQHLRASPRPPREVDPHVPADLEAACLRCLQKDPAARFASARHLAAVLGERFEPPFVGRAAALARAEAFLDDVQNGADAGAAIVIAPRGHGRTTFLEAMAQRARARGLRVVLGAARPGDRPLGALVGLWRLLRRTYDDVVLHDAFDGDATTTIERWAVGAPLRQGFLSLAPAVLILDDAEHCDPATRDVLTHWLKTGFGSTSVGVVFGFDANATTGGRARLLSQSRVRPIDLPALTPSDVEEWVASLVGGSADADSLAQRLHAEASGSPGWIADILASLRASGAIVTSPSGGSALATRTDGLTLPLPASLLAAQRQRVERLSPAAHRVGEVLALGRRPLDVAVIRDVTGIDVDAFDAAADELANSGVAEESPDGDVDALALSANSLANALVEHLSPETVRAHHRSIGESIERRRRRPSADDVSDLAWHFERAEVWTKAYAYLLRSAELHLARSSYEETLLRTDAALALEPQARTWMMLADADRDLILLQLARAAARFHLGRVDDALAAAREAEALAVALGDPRLESRVSSELGTILRTLGTDIAAAQRHLERAVSRAEAAGDRTLLPAARYQLGAHAWSQRDLPEAERQWRESLAIAEQVGDQRATAQGYNGLGILALSRGQSQLARENLERSAAAFERIGMFAPLSVARVNLIELYANTGSLRLALEVADKTMATARDVHHVQSEAMVRAYRALVLLHAFRLDEAIREATLAIDVSAGLGVSEDETFARAVRVAAHLEAADPTQALADLGILIPMLARHDAEGLTPLVNAWHAEALAQTADVEAARAALTLASAPSPWPHVQVRADLALGRAAVALGDAASAVTFWRRALDRAEATSLRTWQLRAQDLLARHHPDESTRARHRRVAAGLAAALAAAMPSSDASAFLARGWGG